MNSLQGTPTGFFQAGGALSPDSPSYVVREADQRLLKWTLEGEYCNLVAARQLGKSSLVTRICKRLQEQNVRSTVIDLSILGTTKTTPEQWYYTLIHKIGQGLRVQIDERQWWHERSLLGFAQRFGEFLRQVILSQIPGQIVVFIDETDTTQSLDFTDDLFAAIRAMYNNRASTPEYKRLTFVLSGMAQPADLIRDRQLTPYNIGRTLDLADFDAQNAKTLLPGLATVYPDQAERMLRRVLYWTEGHPYLTQRLCIELVASGDNWSDERIDRLVARLFFREGQIRQETNLQRIDEYIRTSPHREEMLGIYRDILAGKRVADEERSIAKSQLKLSGLVKPTSAGVLKIRNRIYERVFGPDWAGVSERGPKPVPPPPSPSWWPRVVIPLVVIALLVGIGWPLYNVIRGPRPTTTVAIQATDTPSSTIAPTSSPSETPTGTIVPPTATDTSVPTSTPKIPVASPTSTNTPTPTSTTPTAAPTETDTPTATPTSTVVPPTATHTPTTPVGTPTSGPTLVPLIKLPNPSVTASRWASIFASPDSASEELGAIAPGEQITVRGRTAPPLSDKWLYVYQESTDTTGYAWGPYFQWPKLELVNAAPNSFCNAQGNKRAGLRVEVRGGDARYTFYWGNQVIPAVEPEGGDSYLIHWPWGAWSNVGTLTVTSGDEQSARWSTDLFVREPTCSP